MYWNLFFLGNIPFPKGQEIYRLRITSADALILCTALGGDHNKDYSPVQVVNAPSLLSLLTDTKVPIMRIRIEGCSCIYRILGGGEESLRKRSFKRVFGLSKRIMVPYRRLI